MLRRQLRRLIEGYKELHSQLTLQNINVKSLSD